MRKHECHFTTLGKELTLFFSVRQGENRYAVKKERQGQVMVKKRKQALVENRKWLVRAL
jgi:hypothetical protein